MVVKQLHRVAGDAHYAPMPTPGSNELEDLRGEVLLAALEASADSSWEECADAAYNAGRRFLYKLDAEIPDSFIGQADEDNEHDDLPSVIESGAWLGQGRGSVAGPGGQPWDADETDEDYDRPGRVTGPKLDRRVLTLELRLERGELQEPEQTIVRMWSSPAERIGELTGLSSVAVRKRKQRLLESVTDSVAQDQAISPPFVDQPEDEIPDPGELPRTFSP